MFASKTPMGYFALLIITDQPKYIFIGEHQLILLSLYIVMILKVFFIRLTPGAKRQERWKVSCLRLRRSFWCQGFKLFSSSLMLLASLAFTGEAGAIPPRPHHQVVPSIAPAIPANIGPAYKKYHIQRLELIEQERLVCD